MALDPSIILAGRAPNILGSMAQGTQLRAAHDEMARGNALRALMQQHGQGLAQGDPNALGAFLTSGNMTPQEGVDLGGALLGQDATRLNMDVARHGMAYDDARLEIAREEVARQAAEAARQMSAEQRAQAAEALQRTLTAGGFAYQQGPDAFAAWAAQNPDLGGVDYESWPMHAAEAGVAAETISGFVPQPAEWNVLPPEEAQGLGLTDGVYQRGRDGKIAEIGGGGTTVNVGPNGIDYGDPGDGLVWQRDPQGNVMLDERGAPVAIPYQGGKVWQDQQAAEAEAQGAQAAQGEAAASDLRSADVVLTDIGRLKELVQSSPRWNPAAGFGAETAGNVGGTNAANAAALISTIGANIGFDRLEQMRKESPTGGALGSITENELKMLSAVLGSLAQTQSPEQLIQNLDRLEQLYQSIQAKAAAYPNAAAYGFAPETAQAAPQASGAVNPGDLSDDDLINHYLQGGSR